MEKSEKTIRKSFFKVSSTPGPGSYTIPSTINEGPKYSLRGRQKSKSFVSMPGPGQYDIVSEKTSGYVMGFAKREETPNDNIKSDLPGPGSYTIPHKYLGIP